MDKQKIKVFILAFFIVIIGWTSIFSAALPAKVLVLKLNTPIVPPLADYVERVFSHVESAKVVILEIDTPGGLLTSAERIIKKILSLNIPTVAFVHPKGGTAASAGAFIALSCDYLLMADGTRIGAAHPVSLMKLKNDDKIIKEKITQDILAEMKGILSQKRKSHLIRWVEKMVLESKSYSVTDAIKMGIAVGKVNSYQGVEEFLQKKKIIKGKVDFKVIPKNFKEKFLSTILTPDMAFMLLSLGSLGILIELYTPTVGLAGTVGVISLLLGLYDLSVLPSDYTGWLFLLAAAVMFLLELKGLGGGILAFGGTVSLVLGGIYLFPYQLMGYAFSVSLKLLLTVAGIILFVLLVILRKVVAAQHQEPYHSQEKLVGKEAEVIGGFNEGRKGIVRVEGEDWSAILTEDNFKEVKKGEFLIIIGIKGNFLIVSKKGE